MSLDFPFSITCRWQRYSYLEMPRVAFVMTVSLVVNRLTAHKRQRAAAGQEEEDDVLMED